MVLIMFILFLLKLLEFSPYTTDMQFLSVNYWPLQKHTESAGLSFLPGANCVIEFSWGTWWQAIRFLYQMRTSRDIYTNTPRSLIWSSFRRVISIISQLMAKTLNINYSFIPTFQCCTRMLHKIFLDCVETRKVTHTKPFACRDLNIWFHDPSST